MGDIVERLRNVASFIEKSTGDKAAWVHEAASEIERLRTLLKHARMHLEYQPDKVTHGVSTSTMIEKVDAGLSVMGKHRAAFINAIAEEGTKAEAVEFLQQTWDELCDAWDALAQEREACAKVAEAQAEIFSSEEYAVGQPISSFGERFACGQIAAAIRARK